MPTEAAMQKFRKMLIENDNFRAKFAADPVTALRDAGIDVPKGTKLPKVDRKELDDRVQKLKDHFKDEIGVLYDTDKARALKGRDLVKANTLGNFSLTDPRKIAGTGPVYTISVFGTLDW